MTGSTDLPRLLLEIFNRQPDPLFIKDHESRYLYVNPEFSRFMNLETDFIVGKDDFGVMSETQANICRSHDAAVLDIAASEAVKTHSSDELLITPQGARQLFITRFGLHRPDGKAFLFGVIRDLTAQREKESRQMATERRLRDVLEMIDEVMWAHEWGTWNTVFMSPSATKFWGVPADSIHTPADWVRAFTPAEIARMEELFLSNERNGIDQFNGEFKFTHPVRGDRIAFIRAKIIRDENGKPTQIEGLTSDITDIKQAEAEIQEQRQKLLALAKLNTLGELASGIGHEINTPLSGILSKIARVETALRSIDPISDGVAVKSARLLKESMDLVERVAQIVEGLKQLSRNATNEEAELFDPVVALEQALSLSRGRFSNHGIRIEIANSLPDGTRVIGRPTSLFQAIVNLLNNSFDSLEGSTRAEPKKVRLELGASASRVFIRIIDNGIGIPKAMRARLFEAFHTSKTEGKGTGLGLHLSRKLLRAHGADLVLLDPDGGTTAFEISLAKSENPSPGIPGRG